MLKKLLLILILLLQDIKSSSTHKINLIDLNTSKKTNTYNEITTISEIPDQTVEEFQLNMKKKNLSAYAQKLILAQNDLKIVDNTANFGNARSVFNKNEFCHSMPDGLYDDPEYCEKFVICFVQQTFSTKCADGTKWNHHTKECDYPELVDCSRGTTTTTTKKLSTLFTTTKVSVKSSKETSITTTNYDSTVTPERQKIRMDILLTIILVPSGLLLLVVIILVLWMIKNKIERGSKNIQKNSDTFFSSMQKEKSTKSGFFCFFKNPAVNNKSETFNTTAHKTQKTVFSNINSSDHNDNSGIIPYSIVQSYDHVNKLLHGTTSQPISNSYGTSLSSHFEENNWDYNFAMRGLYLTQPWVKGKHYSNVESLSLESNSDKTTIEDRFNNTKNNKTRKTSICSTKHGGSDTDGFYA